MTTKFESCDTCDEYGYCEDHCKVVCQREGAAVRTADELLSVFIDDAQGLGVQLSPWGRDLIREYDANLAEGRAQFGGSGSAWLSTDDAGQALADDAQTLVNQVESDLATAGYGVEWLDGYLIYTLPERD